MRSAFSAVFIVPLDSGKLILPPHHSSVVKKIGVSHFTLVACPSRLWLVVTQDPDRLVESDKIPLKNCFKVATNTLILPSSYLKSAGLLNEKKIIVKGRGRTLILTSLEQHEIDRVRLQKKLVELQNKNPVIPVSRLLTS
jgi:hypothetical protein